MEKAYKLLAIQEKISNGQAKRLIDDGQVYVGNKKVAIARALMDPKNKFRVLKSEAPRKLFEDENLIAVDKPAFYVSENLEKRYNAPLLHRLDKETSGVILLVKNEEFQKRAIQAFKAQEVYKEYLAVVSGILPEALSIDAPIKTIKGHRARSVISKQGQQAESLVTLLEVSGKKSLVSVVIKTGRTHQIRVHLAHVGHPIIGDTLYGGRSHSRMMLHSKRIELLGYEFEAEVPKAFATYLEHH